MKNTQNSMKKQGEKLIICYFMYLLIRDKKPSKPSEKNGEKN